MKTQGTKMQQTHGNSRAPTGNPWKPQGILRETCGKPAGNARAPGKCKFAHGRRELRPGSAPKVGPRRFGDLKQDGRSRARLFWRTLDAVCEAWGKMLDQLKRKEISPLQMEYEKGGREGGRFGIFAPFHVFPGHRKFQLCWINSI